MSLWVSQSSKFGVRTHTYTCTHTRTHTHTRSLTHTHTLAYAHTHTHSHAHTRSHAHTHTHLRAHTHTEVRSAAVSSMCQLGMQSSSFAAQSLDYLVDMFNDEIEGVRLQAIKSLCKISSTLELREDQLETVLAILEVRTWCGGGIQGG